LLNKWEEAMKTSRLLSPLITNHPTQKLPWAQLNGVSDVPASNQNLAPFGAWWCK